MEKGRTRFWIPSLTPVSISGKNSCWLEILKLLPKKGKRPLTTVSGSQGPDAFCQLTSCGVCPLLLALPISEPGWKCGSFAVPLTSDFGTLGLPVQTLAGQFSAAPPGGPGRPAPPSDSLAGHPVAHVGGGGQQRRGRSNPARRCQASSTLGSDHPNARAPLWGSERLGCSRAASFRRPAPPSLGRPACLITSSGLL